MVLFIKPEKGNLIELNLSLEVSIEKIKELVQIHTNIPQEQQILTINNQKLNEGQLYYYLLPQVYNSVSFISNYRNKLFEYRNQRRNQENDQKYELTEQEKQKIEKEVILKEINKENIIINLEELKEKLKIFIKTEKRIVEIEVEPNQQIRYLKIQLQKKWGVSVTQQCLRFGSKLLFDETTFSDYDIRSGDILYFSLKPQQYQFQTQGGYQVMVTQLNSETEVDKAQKLKQNKPSEILITPKL